MAKKQTPKKRVVTAPTGLPQQEDPLAMIKNIAGIVSQVKGSATPPMGTPAGPRVDLPATPDIRTERREAISRGVGAVIGGEAGDPGTGFRGGRIAKKAAATGRASLQTKEGPVVSPGFTGEEIAQIARERFPERTSTQAPVAATVPEVAVQPRQPAPSSTAQPVSPLVFDAAGNVIGTKSGQEVIPLTTGATGVPAITEAAPAGAPAEAKAAAEKKGGLSFLEDPDVQRALLTAGTNILEQADPTGAFTQISRGALEGVKAFDVRKAGRAKAGKEAKKEERAVAGEKREEKRLGLEERRVRAAELAAKSKKTGEDVDEERRIKAELSAAEEVRKEGGTLAEQLNAAEQARQLVGFAGGRGVVAAEGVPAETPGFISRLFGAEPKPATPARVAFPRRRTPTQQKLRQGVDQKTAKQSFRDFL